MKEYITSDKVSARKGNNIIIISLESFERGFLNTRNAHLTKNLSELKRQWNYYPMEQNLGSSWTSGSLYTYMTGMPAFFDILNYNSVFQTTCHSNITSIGHILKSAGYNMTYMIDDAQFAGTDALLYSIEIHNIIDKSFFQERIENNTDEWIPAKVHDKDLFEKAKHEVLRLNKQDKPFALFISTVDTHAPNGIYDERMEEVLPKQNSDLDFMISVADYLVGDFIEFLQEEKIIESTSIYIFPDHLMMATASAFSNPEDKGLFLITNTDSSAVLNNINGLFYQVDLPKIILEGANVNHNAKFLSDYIESDKNKFISENINLITALNVAGLTRFDDNNGYTISTDTTLYTSYANDVNRFIAHAGGMIEGNIYTNSLEALDTNYKRGFRLMELDIQKTRDNKYVAVHDWNQWASMVGYSGDLPASYKEFMSHKILGKYQALDMERINGWFDAHKDAILVTDKTNDPVEFSNVFIDKGRLMMELFTFEAVYQALNAGIKSAMPSHNLVSEMDKKSAKNLKEKGVSEMVISRSYISRNVDFLTYLKDLGIHVYVYHLNSFDGRDEDYVVKNEMKYIYGIYADKWDFNKLK